MNSHAPAGGRIAVLSPLVIDQIAAGEVVERPASVVKELVDNSLDAGSTRIDVELEDGGLARISVRDNGRGIHPDDLPLAVTRHATSKLRDTSDLHDIRTLGFRGEALASVAAVARIDVRSRQASAPVGTHLHGIPGEPHMITPAGMPVGTQIDVHALFANVPARRKFMRAEATEVGQVSETLLRLAIVHPDVHFTLRHGKRELLNLPRTDLAGRVAQVLERRVAGPFFAFAGEDDGVRVEAYLPHPSAVARGRGSPYLITRKRVVRERSLGQILAQAYGIAEAPSACLIVEPPPGAVDVNVHPQKTEIRFSDPQQVYAAVRRVLAAAMAAAPWASELAARAGDAARSAPVPTDMPPSAAPHGPGDMSVQPAAEAPALPVGTARAGRPGRPTPGPAGARVERTAAAAAADRRASADAWIARAEAAVDRAEPLHDVGAPPPSPRPAPAQEPQPPADDWDLDLAGSAARPDLSREPAAHDLSSEPAHRDATDRAPSVDLSSGPARRDAADRAPDAGMSPGPAHRDARDLSHGPTDLSRGPAPPPPAPEPASPDAAPAWLARADATADDLPATSAPRDHAAAWIERAGGDVPPDLGEVPLLRWSEQQPEPPPRPPEPAPEDRPAAAGGYRLSTRALGPDYDRHKRAVMDAAAALRPADAQPRAPEPARAPAPEAPALFDPGPRQPDAPEPRDMRETSGPIGQPTRVDAPALLACLPGPVALFADREALLAVDLRRVRSHLVYLRLQRDLLGRRAVAVQGLLTPAVVRRGAADVALLTAARAELLTLGVDLEAFGDDAVVVRGVPAHLRHCVDDADAADLVARIVPWLRIRAGDGDRAARERGLLDAIATTRGGDPAPRLARRWLAELLEAGGSLESVPGIRRWDATALLGGA